MISFDKVDFDLGTIAIGTVPHMTVNIQNNYNIPVEISITNSSCSCTTGSIDKNPVPQKAKAIISIFFNTSQAGRGMLTKAISASWVVDGLLNSQVFRFKANVV